ncbi:hypothetical protein AB4Y45_43920 [Paraburkholderia sp. EG287A]|uniref:hypothetical protein n=1 Tax=Paraburkholderia sp. EG287A TaxID=3237012 RepID=UPI0034D1A0D4
MLIDAHIVVFGPTIACALPPTGVDSSEESAEKQTAEIDLSAIYQRGQIILRNVGYLNGTPDAECNWICRVR